MSVVAAGVWLMLTVAEPQGVDEIASRVGQVSHDATVAELETFVAANPKGAQTGRALLLAAQLRRADGREDLARILLERAVLAAPASPVALDASLALSDLEFSERHFEAAIARYQKVLETASGRWEYQARLGIEYSRAARTRQWLVVGIWAGLVLLASWRGVVAVRAGTLWPLPEDAKVGLPVAALLALASAGQPPNEAHAVLALAAGGAILLWTNAAYFQVAPPIGWRRWFEASLGIAQAAGLLYCAIVVSGLWAKFVETLSAGAGE